MLCCKVYKNMLPINNVWCQNITKLLYKLGFDYVWLAGGPGNPKAFMSDFKERIYDLARRNLYDNIMVARKCEVYKDIQSNLSKQAGYGTGYLWSVYTSGLFMQV